jgi:glycerate dehydrogenase
MRIVVMDGHTTNPGDLSWEELEALGDCTVYARTEPAAVVERAREADVLIVNKVLLPATVIAQLPKLRYIGLLSTGVNVVDVAAAKARGIPVCNVPAYSTMSVAQLVFAHVLALAQHVERHSEGATAGRWAASADFCYWDGQLTELDGLTLGLVGYGQIGRAVARIGRAFGMRVAVHTRTPGIDTDDLRFVPLDELFRIADVVSLHCPLTPATERLVNAGTLALMKPTAFLVNTGRGGLVDETALAAALNGGRLAGAGLDVLTSEPPSADNPLLGARHCLVTPHIAWATRAARARLVAAVAGNVAAFLAGAPRNNVCG